MYEVFSIKTVRCGVVSAGGLAIVFVTQRFKLSEENVFEVCFGVGL